MRVYAHWLDGEYRKALAGGMDQPHPWTQQDAQAERLLKTFALFGVSVVLGDAQLVDSPVLWRLFASESFRRFARQESAFLQLRASPVTPQADRRWAIASAGLELAVRAGRISTPMNDAAGFVKLYREILADGPAPDIDGRLAQRSKHPDIGTMTGFAEAFRYFLSSTSNVDEPPKRSARLTLYDVLTLARESSRIGGTDERHITATIDLIDGMGLDPADRVRRAVIHNHLDFTRPAHVGSWRTIVQAWNVAVQRSVCDTGGSIGNLPRSVPIGAYVDQPVDVLLEVDERQATMPSPSETTTAPTFSLNWDPADLTWVDLLVLREKTDDARAVLYAAIESQESRHVIDALRRFGEVLAKNAPNRLAAPVKPFVWGIGGVVVYFAAPAVLPALGLAKGSEEVIVRLLNAYRDRIIATRVVELASTLGLTREKDGAGVA